MLLGIFLYNGTMFYELKNGTLMGDDEISKELYYQSYYLCKVIGYQVGLEIVKKEAKEYLDLTLS